MSQNSQGTPKERRYVRIYNIICLDIFVKVATSYNQARYVASFEWNFGHDNGMVIRS